MILQEYTRFSQISDWTLDRPDGERLTVARYGIASEVGSLVAALKKKMLQTPSKGWNVPTDEILEELGDVLWYTTMLARLTDQGSIQEVCKADLESLPKEIDANEHFKAALPSGNYDKFIVESRRFIKKYQHSDFDSYQKIAILTARTQGRELLDVCITRLLLYATSVMSHQFPAAEYHLKQDIVEFSPQRTLGMVMWHLSAIAGLYGVMLNDVARINFDKLNSLYNLEGAEHTSLHDDGDEVPASQRFPRNFIVAFVSAGPGRLQMYLDGKPLGDEIDDNSDDEDGYRFHDVMHLANVAKLGWSPVLRGLMGRKRKYDPKIDRNQDGARAQIVEEAVVKAIHSEGKRIGAAEIPGGVAGLSLFTRKDQIPFSFLKLICTLVDGLEVEENTYWEWLDAILEGHAIYAKLCSEGQGSVFVDLQKRSIEYSPHVYLNGRGLVVGVVNERYVVGGDVDATKLTAAELSVCEPQMRARLVAEKRAIIQLLGMDPTDLIIFQQFQVTRLEGGKLSVKGDPGVQAAIWRAGILGFRSYTTGEGAEEICCVNAIGSPG